MIRHVVLMNWNDGTTADQIQRVGQGFAELAEQIPGIVAYEFGPDAGLYRGNADYVLVAQFETVELFKTYVDHPAHQAFLTDIAGPILASFQSAQFEIRSRHPYVPIWETNAVKCSYDAR